MTVTYGGYTVGADLTLTYCAKHRHDAEHQAGREYGGSLSCRDGVYEERFDDEVTHEAIETLRTGHRTKDKGITESAGILFEGTHSGVTGDGDAESATNAREHQHESGTEIGQQDWFHKLKIIKLNNYYFLFTL